MHQENKPNHETSQQKRQEGKFKDLRTFAVENSKKKGIHLRNTRAGRLWPVNGCFAQKLFCLI